MVATERDTAPTRRTVLVGADLLDLSRVPAQVALARRILRDEEAQASRRWAHGAYAYLALKEAIVKAVGGRPPGFRWQSAVVEGPVARASCPTALLQLVGSMGQHAGAPVFVGCRLDGELLGWARARLAVADDVALDVTGMWTANRSDELIAVVVIEPKSEQAFGVHHRAVI